MYILFAGNTGVGKSSVIEQVSDRLSDSVVFSDPYIDNPFLSSAYNNSQKAFQSQMFFIKEFYKIHSAINGIADKVILQERSIYECLNIFCKQFFIQKKIDRDEYKLFDEFVSILGSNLRKPDRIVYLTASIQAIENRINQRDRNFEKCFDAELIELQTNLYKDWVYSFSELNKIELSVIDTDNLAINNVSDIVMNLIY